MLLSAAHILFGWRSRRGAQASIQLLSSGGWLALVERRLGSSCAMRSVKSTIERVIDVVLIAPIDLLLLARQRLRRSRARMFLSRSSKKSG